MTRGHRWKISELVHGWVSLIDRYESKCTAAALLQMWPSERALKEEPSAEDILQQHALLLASD